MSSAGSRAGSTKDAAPSTEAARAAARQLVRPIIVSNVTTAFGFGLLAVIPVTPVQEMALFGAAGELLSGLHVVFVLPMCLVWLGAAGELASERTLFAGERWMADVALARSPPGSHDCSAFASACWSPMAAGLRRDRVADLDGEVRLDVPRHDRADRAVAHRLRALRRGRPAERAAEHRHPPRRPSSRSSTPR